MFVQHDHVSPPGPVGERFAQRGYEVEEFLVVPAERYDTPGVDVTFPDPADFDALVIMGAPWATYDHPLVGSWVQPELAMLRRADGIGVPVMGICFGGQLLATAHGGSVHRGEDHELGWHHVDTDRPDLVTRGPWFQWHFDRWITPPGVHDIARTAVAPQAFILRRNLAVQFHPELDPVMLDGWLNNGGTAELIQLGYDPDEVVARTADEAPAARRRSHGLVDAFLATVATARVPIGWGP